MLSLPLPMTPDKIKYFIEAESSQRTETGSFASGDVCMSRRTDDGRTLLTLIHGRGSGIQANVTASVISSMIVSYALRNTPVGQAAGSVLNTFGGRGSKTDASFAVADIQADGTVGIAEYEAPAFLLFRNGRLYEGDGIQTERLDIATGNGQNHTIRLSRFGALPEDRIVLYTKGIIRSGSGTQRLPNGWTRTGLAAAITGLLETTPDISARELATAVVNRAEANDLFVPKSDLSCMSVYFRQPRRLLLCSGPPFNETNDRKLAERVENWNGTTVICGGTTAAIVARELRREISVNLRRDISGLPPTSTMPGVTLITEGVLTLARVKSLLEQASSSELTGQGTDFELARILLGHDRIEFVVGTRINPQHQDPALPVELELRRNVIKEIARLLETKFLKEIRTEYL